MALKAGRVGVAPDQVDSYGKIDAGGYTLPVASANTLGGVKVGTGLSIADGVLSSDNPTPYVLPIAAAAVLGGIKIGSGLSIDADGVVSAAGGITPKYLGRGVTFNLPIPSLSENEFALWVGFADTFNSQQPLTFVHCLRLSDSLCVGSTNTNVSLSQYVEYITATSNSSTTLYVWYRLI